MVSGFRRDVTTKTQRHKGLAAQLKERSNQAARPLCLCVFVVTSTSLVVSLPKEALNTHNLVAACYFVCITY